MLEFFAFVAIVCLVCFVAAWGTDHPDPNKEKRQ